MPNKPLPFLRARNIKLVKHSLFILAIGLIGLLVILPLTNKVEERFKITYTPSEDDKTDTPMMIKPHFQGVDSQNQLYNIIADTAMQLSTDEIQLHKIQADITLESEQWLSLTADTGMVHLQKKTLDLQGNVDGFSDEGYEFKSTEAHIDLSNGLANGDYPVTIQGPPGVLHAEGFDIIEQGNVIRFTGPVKLVIYMKE